eukprot:1151991-Pelagomonas_calceolata.AAC.2
MPPPTLWLPISLTPSTKLLPPHLQPGPSPAIAADSPLNGPLRAAAPSRQPLPPSPAPLRCRPLKPSLSMLQS